MKIVLLATSLSLLFLNEAAIVVAHSSSSSTTEQQVEVTASNNNDVQHQDHRELLFWGSQCERSCLFWCHCSDYECVTVVGGGSRRHRQLNEMGLIDKDLNEYSSEELMKLEFEAMKDQENNSDNRKLFFSSDLFGTCRSTISKEYLQRYLSNKEYTMESIPNKEEATEIIKDWNGNPEATHAYTEQLLTTEECEMVIDYFETSPNKKTKSKHFNLTDTYSADFLMVTGMELETLLGGEERMSDVVHFMLEYFVGETLFPERYVISGRISYAPPDPKKHLDFHLDRKNKYATLIINLNNEYEGGDIIYLTSDGATVQERGKGDGVIHTPEAVHGLTSVKGGGRYALHVFLGFPSDMIDDSALVD